MNALDHRVVGHHKPVSTTLEHRGIVFKSARAGMQRQRPQRGDEICLVQRPLPFATASSTPFTNFASRSSKKALATSTYSPIAVPVLTSARAISS